MQQATLLARVEQAIQRRNELHREVLLFGDQELEDRKLLRVLRIEQQACLKRLHEATDTNTSQQLQRDVAQRNDVMAELKDDIRLTTAKMERMMEMMEAENAAIAAMTAEVDTQLEADTNYDYFDHVRQLGTPSSLCKADNWRKAQEGLVYLCHIPPEAEPPFPLTLAHPAFANFVDRFNTSRIEFGNQECQLVVDLCNLVVHDFKNEKEKMNAFNALLGKYLGQKFFPITVKSCTTDGSVVSERHMVYSVEGKINEGNTLFQAIHYYGLFLSEMEEHDRESTFCPCFLVELVGVHIRISGLAFFSKVACQPFTPFMHCYINSYDKTDMDSLCRAMLGLKKGVSELLKYYSAPPPKVDKRIPYPLQEKQVRYVERIGAKKLLFLVEMKQTRERRLFKYCKRYGKEVHKRWAQEGDLAPKLFDCSGIAGGWFAVEMEYLSPDDWKSVHQWCNNVPEVDKSELQLAVEDALLRAHGDMRAPNKDSIELEDVSQRVEFAHGDMRAPNIMARSVEGGFNIKFVDFDWAGAVSSTFYPSFINTEEKWHEDVAPGMPLSQAHDKWWVDKWITVKQRKSECMAWAEGSKKAQVTRGSSS